MNHACIALMVALFFYGTCQAGELSGFVVARQPAPVFNSPESARPGAIQRLDRCRQVRELEFIALPGTVFRLVAASPKKPGVLQVTTDEYQPPEGTRLYVDAALLDQLQQQPASRRPPVPQRGIVLERLRTAVGLPYIWGGNLRDGVSSGGLRQFVGLDCSGLLYEATDGFTPRNTDQLVHFGKAVSVEGLEREELAHQLRPLDLIVWKGHVIIVLDQTSCIESVMNCGEKHNGVVVTPLKTRLEQLLKQRKPSNVWPPDKKKAALFVVRRWL